MSLPNVTELVALGEAWGSSIVVVAGLAHAVVNLLRRHQREVSMRRAVRHEVMAVVAPVVERVDDLSDRANLPRLVFAKASGR